MMHRALRFRRAWAGAVLMVLIGMFVLTLAPPAWAWDDCPKGLVNDPYPGACSRYVDTNNDGICDHSQPAPAAPTTTAAPITATTASPTTVSPATATTASPTPSTSSSLVSSTTAGTSSPAAATDGTEADSAQAAAMALATPPSGGSGGTGTGGSGTSTDGSGGGAAAATPLPSNTSKPALGIKYNLSPIAIAFFIIYFASFILYKTHRMRVTTHRKIWNVLLLLTFLFTGVLGMLLVIRLNYGLRFNLPFDMLFWHVETGIVMSLISFFHIGWHLKYYRNLLRRRHEHHEGQRVATAAEARGAARRRHPERGERAAVPVRTASLRPVRPYAEQDVTRGA